jgi:hypothetical protein
LAAVVLALMSLGRQHSAAFFAIFSGFIVLTVIVYGFLLKEGSYSPSRWTTAGWLVIGNLIMMDNPLPVAIRLFNYVSITIPVAIAILLPPDGRARTLFIGVALGVALARIGHSFVG